jgi:hypothetical protein
VTEQHVAGDGEERAWLSSQAVHRLIRQLAEATGATAHGPAEWGDRNADADVMTSPEAHGLITVNYDTAREAFTHPAQPMAVYVYPMPRRRRRTEHIADYAYEAMCDADGANREPVEVTGSGIDEAIAAGLVLLTP